MANIPSNAVLELFPSKRARDPCPQLFEVSPKAYPIANIYIYIYISIPMNYPEESIVLYCSWTRYVCIPSSILLAKDANHACYISTYRGIWTSIPTKLSYSYPQCVGFPLSTYKHQTRFDNRWSLAIQPPVYKSSWWKVKATTRKGRRRTEQAADAKQIESIQAATKASCISWSEPSQSGFE